MANAFPGAVWLLFAAAMIISAIGFIKYVWFISLGYGFSIAGLGFLMLYLFKDNLSCGTILLCLLFVAYGFRLGGYLLFRGELFLPDLAQLGGLLWSGIFTYAIAYTFWAQALAEGETAKISNLAYITPFLSLVWTAVFLKEQVRFSSVLGLSVIVLGIFIQLKDRET